MASLFNGTTSTCYVMPMHLQWIYVLFQFCLLQYFLPFIFFVCMRRRILVTVVHALVTGTSHLDQYNSVLYRISDLLYHIRDLQLIQNSAARIVTNT